MLAGPHIRKCLCRYDSRLSGHTEYHDRLSFAIFGDDLGYSVSVKILQRVKTILEVSPWASCTVKAEVVALESQSDDVL